MYAFQELRFCASNALGINLERRSSFSRESTFAYSILQYFPSISISAFLSKRFTVPVLLNIMYAKPSGSLLIGFYPTVID